MGLLTYWRYLHREREFWSAEEQQMNNLQVKEGETLFVSAAAGAVGRYSSDCAPLLATPLMWISVLLDKLPSTCTIARSLAAAVLASLQPLFFNRAFSAVFYLLLFLPLLETFMVKSWWIMLQMWHRARVGLWRCDRLHEVLRKCKCRTRLQSWTQRARPKRNWHVRFIAHAIFFTPQSSRLSASPAKFSCWRLNLPHGHFSHYSNQVLWKRRWFSISGSIQQLEEARADCCVWQVRWLIEFLVMQSMAPMLAFNSIIWPRFIALIAAAASVITTVIITWLHRQCLLITCRWYTTFRQSRHDFLSSLADCNLHTSCTSPLTHFCQCLVVFTFLTAFDYAQGFMCMPWLSGQKGTFLRDMNAWLQDGKVARPFFCRFLQLHYRNRFEGACCGMLLWRHRAVARRWIFWFNCNSICCFSYDDVPSQRLHLCSRAWMMEKWCVCLLLFWSACVHESACLGVFVQHVHRLSVFSRKEWTLGAIVYFVYEFDARAAAAHENKNNNNTCNNEGTQTTNLIGVVILMIKIWRHWVIVICCSADDLYHI